ncbi:hypothetical protein Lal_00023093 [Lupinus albus]|nr:hypothetical protein Lal_00023093 [Lupinus albus]
MDLETPQDQSKVVGGGWHCVLKELLRSPKKQLVIIMEMKKVACAVLIAAASMSAAMAATEVPAPAPGPSTSASATLPIVGSLVGASVLSFFALFH